MTEIKTEINSNIEIINTTQIFSEYHAEYYRNNKYNEISYIVVHDDGNEEFIDCLLLNINIFDYIDSLGKGDFSTHYLREFDLFHYNGFLGVRYYGENDIRNIENFFKKYGDYFIKDYKPYIKHITEEVNDRVIKLHNEILTQIKIRDKLGELFSDK